MSELIAKTEENFRPTYYKMICVRNNRQHLYVMRQFVAMYGDIFVCAEPDGFKGWHYAQALKQSSEVIL